MAIPFHLAITVTPTTPIKILLKLDFKFRQNDYRLISAVGNCGVRYKNDAKQNTALWVEVEFNLFRLLRSRKPSRLY